MGLIYLFTPKLWFKFQKFFLSPINDICSLTIQLSKNNKFQFYITDRKRYEKIRKVIKDYSNRTFLRLKINDENIFIIHNLESFENILTYFKRAVFSKSYNPKFTENLSISFYELKRLSNRKIIDLLKTQVNDIVEDNEGIIINQEIIPDKVFYGNPPRLYKLPKNYSTKINSIKIILTPNGYISNIYIDSKHPNCDNLGFFCVNKTFRRKLNYDLVLEIMENLKIYNFNGFYYYIPENLDLNNLERI